MVDDRKKNIEDAVRAARSGFSQRDAAKRYGISRSTLRYRLNGGQSHTAAHESDQRLSKEQEKQLCDWITI